MFFPSPCWFSQATQSSSHTPETGFWGWVNSTLGQICSASEVCDQLEGAAQNGPCSWDSLLCFSHQILSQFIRSIKSIHYSMFSYLTPYHGTMCALVKAWMIFFFQNFHFNTIFLHILCWVTNTAATSLGQNCNCMLKSDVSFQCVNFKH